MADDTRQDDSGIPEDSSGKEGAPDSDENEGLGNLPPLSDFESSGGDFESDSLPPMGAQEPQGDKESVGGLPPIDEIPIETPVPTGGNIKAPPPGFQSDFETPEFKTPAFATPQEEEKSGFQDLAADSDFSPETPEVGPGPDSDMDTPLFDSAFGGAEGDFSPQAGTPAPTQAMETPMFDAGAPAGAPSPFEEGAFAAGGELGAPVGTPMPDMSPDTGMPPTAEVPEAVAPKVAKKKRAKAGGVGGLLVKAALLIVGLLVGIGAGPYVGSKLAMLPNPLREVIAGKEAEISRLNNTIAGLQKAQTDPAKPAVSREELDEMIKQKDQLAATIGELSQKQEQGAAALKKTTSQLDAVKQDLEMKNEEFVTAQETFEDLLNQTAIVQARQKGLSAEVTRLTDLVGELEDANARRIASKEALGHSVDRLMVAIKEGIPLTPEKYSRENRIAAVEDLKAKLEAASAVTPALMDAYASIHLTEMEVAAATEYFFANIPVTDRLGNRAMKWAECLMKGNWAVSYRTLDGKNIGVYQNLGEPGAPRYDFVENLPEKVQKQIEEEIFACRVPDYEEKIRVLAQKQLITKTRSRFQEVFDTL